MNATPDKYDRDEIAGSREELEKKREEFLAEEDVAYASKVTGLGYPSECRPESRECEPYDGADGIIAVGKGNRLHEAEVLFENGKWIKQSPCLYAPVDNIVYWFAPAPEGGKEVLYCKQQIAEGVIVRDEPGSWDGGFDNILEVHEDDLPWVPPHSSS